VTEPDPEFNASPEEEVVRQAHAWLTAAPGRTVSLVTVIETLRSAPRPPGTLMAISTGGASAGSVSGGCVEGALIRQLADGDAAGPPRRLTFGIDEAQAARVGLSCGGQITLAVEFLHDARALAPLVEALDARRALRRTVALRDGAVTLAPAGTHDVFTCTADSFTQVVGPRWQLLILGATDIARYLASHGTALGYRVAVNDPRGQPAAAWLPGTVEFDDRLPEESVHARIHDPRSAVVALLHAAHLEDPALLVALRSPAFYVGALGSAATSARRRERLARLGAGSDQLARLRAPIGLRLGGKSSAEIALAIAAELTAVRHGGLALADAAAAALA